mmetsp:Transcript_18852/g.39417  ORF Transcript_18852/g.39417 Transcript_18852/m.39417 type:complete len:998 (-) Transcript_18852:414-3407(-)
MCNPTTRSPRTKASPSSASPALPLQPSLPMQASRSPGTSPPSPASTSTLTGGGSGGSSSSSGRDQNRHTPATTSANSNSNSHSRSNSNPHSHSRSTAIGPRESRDEEYTGTSGTNYHQQDAAGVDVGVNGVDVDAGINVDATVDAHQHTQDESLRSRTPPTVVPLSLFRIQQQHPRDNASNDIEHEHDDEHGSPIEAPAPSSLPIPPPLPIRTTTATRGTGNTTVERRQQRQRQPFFVLDWMLGDLLPRIGVGMDVDANIDVDVAVNVDVAVHANANEVPPSPIGFHHFLPWLSPWNSNTSSSNSNRVALVTTQETQTGGTVGVRGGGDNDRDAGGDCLHHQDNDTNDTNDNDQQHHYHQQQQQQQQQPLVPSETSHRPGSPVPLPSAHGKGNTLGALSAVGGGGGGGADPAAVEGGDAPASPAAARGGVASPGVPPLPPTPKSSNRRACRNRTHPRRAGVLVERDAGALPSSEPVRPLDLERRLGEAASAPPLPSSSSSLATPSLLPGSDATCHNPNDDGDARRHPSCLGPAKTSASCPQVGNDRDCHDDDDDNDQQQQQQERRLQQRQALQRRKRQQQIDRRERRNKLTIVQRSLTLAQGWNNKGLAMAGRATLAEQARYDEGADANANADARGGEHGNSSSNSGSSGASGGAMDGTNHISNNDNNDTTTSDDDTNETDHLWGFALECWNNALEIYRSLLGESHERVADVQNNRGIALGKLRLYGEALGALGTALEARKRRRRRHVAESENGAASDAAASATDAIVSTLHNIANVHRDAGEPHRALEALVEARGLLLRVPSTGRDTDACGCGSFRLRFHRHHGWHQSARLLTAIGHVHCELRSWRDARNAYVEALQVYEKLSRALSSEISQKQPPPGSTNGNGDGCRCHGNEHGVRGRIDDHETRQQQHRDERNLLRHQHESIRREVFVLEDDLGELDRHRRQRAAGETRTGLQRQRRSNAYTGESDRAPSQQQQHQHQQHHQAMLLSFVQHLRA